MRSRVVWTPWHRPAKEMLLDVPMAMQIIAMGLT